METCIIGLTVTHVFCNKRNTAEWVKTEVIADIRQKELLRRGYEKN